MSNWKIFAWCLAILLFAYGFNLNAQSERIKASYLITLVNPDRMLFKIEAEFEFPEKMDSIIFRIEETDNHYSEGYSQFVKQVTLVTGDSTNVPINDLEQNRWAAYNLRGKYKLSYYVPIQHPMQPSQYGIDETPFFIGTSGVLIGTAMIIYPELEPRLLPKDFPIEFRLAKDMIALLPNKSIGENKYLLPSLEYAFDAYWAVGFYDTLVLGPEENPLKIGVQRDAFSFDKDDLSIYLTDIWRELGNLFGTSPEFNPLLLISKYPFSNRTPEYMNSGAASPGSINILLDHKLNSEHLSNYFGLFVYHLFSQWIPLTFFPENRIEDRWLVNGTANYYQLVLPIRTGIITQEQFLERILSTYEHYSREFDRRNISVRIARDIPAAQSYVQAGELLTACAVDLKMRSSRRPSSLDALLSTLAQRFKGGSNTFSEMQFYEIADTLSGQFLRPFIDSCLNLKTKIDFPNLIRDFGIRIEIIPDGSPDLGMEFAGLTDLTIDDISRGGPAYEAGLEIGDKILKVNGKEYNSVDPLVAFVEGKNKGDKIKIEYLRDKSKEKATLKLGAMDKYTIGNMISPTEAQAERWNKLIAPTQ